MQIILNWMNCSITRIILLLIPLYTFSQISKFEHNELTIFSPIIDDNSIPSGSNLELEFVKFKEELFFIDQKGGYIFKSVYDTLKRIDNSFQHKMQNKSSIYFYNDTIYRQGGYGFWNTRSKLTFFDFSSKEWDIVRTNIEGPKKYSHFTLSKDNKSIFFGGKTSNESIGIRDEDSESVFLFDYLDKKWINLGKSKFKFDKKNRHIKINNDKLLIIDYDTLFLVDPFNNKVNYYKSNSFLNTVISNNQLKSFYKDSIFYFINLIQSTKEFEINTRTYDEVISNKIDETNFIQNKKINYPLLTIIISILMFLIFSKTKTNKTKQIVNIDGNLITYKGNSFLSNDVEIKILKYMSDNLKVSVQDIIGLLDKNELNYNHQLRSLNKTINDLNNKFFVLTGNKLINKEKSSVDKRIVIFTLVKNFNLVFQS